MGRKLVAGIVTAAAIAPICAVCVLGPVVVGSLFAGAFGWLEDFRPLGALALMIATGAGFLVTRHFSRSGIPDSRSDAAGGRLHGPSHSR